MSVLILDTEPALKESVPRVPRIPETYGLRERIALLRKLGASIHYAIGPQPDIYSVESEYAATSRLDATALYQIFLHSAQAYRLESNLQRLAAMLRFPKNVRFLRLIYEKMAFLLLDQERTLDITFKISQQAFETIERHKQWLKRFRASDKKYTILMGPLFTPASVGRGIFCSVFEIHLGLRPLDRLFCFPLPESSGLQRHWLTLWLAYTYPDSPFEQLYHSLLMLMPEIIYAGYDHVC